MSEKEYRIEVDGEVEYVKIKEVEPDYYEPDYSASGRERMGYKLDAWPRWAKILLTIPLNIYGALLRFGGNTVLGVMLGFVDLVIGKICMVLIMSEFESAYEKSHNLSVIMSEAVDYIGWGKWSIILFIPLFLWIIDFFSVLFFNRILLFGMKRYKDYVPKS